MVLLAACRADDRAEGAERSNRAARPHTIYAQAIEKGEAPKRADSDKDARQLARVVATVDLINQSGIDRAQIAQKNAESQAVKDYAAKVAADHKQNAEALKKLVSDKSIDLGPEKEDPTLKAQMAAAKDEQKKLKELKGAAFDTAYLAEQPGESRLLSKLSDEGKKVAGDADVTSFFAKLRSKADEHDKRAMALLPKACGGNGSTTTPDTGTEGRPKPAAPQNEPGTPPAPQRPETTPPEAPPERAPAPPERVP
jgi:putative membrane protein